MSATQFLGLRTVIYKVDELEKATKWYSKVFDTSPYFEEPFYVGFNIAGYELGLETVESGSIAVGNNEISYWGVNNVDKSYQRMLDHGATPHEEPRTWAVKL